MHRCGRVVRRGAVVRFLGRRPLLWSWTLRRRGRRFRHRFQRFRRRAVIRVIVGIDGTWLGSESWGWLEWGFLRCRRWCGVRGIVRDCCRHRRRLLCRCALPYRFVRVVLRKGLVRDVLPGTGRFRLSGGRTGRTGRRRTKRIGWTGWLRHGAPLQNPLHSTLSHGGARTPTLALSGVGRCCPAIRRCRLPST